LSLARLVQRATEKPMTEKPPVQPEDTSSQTHARHGYRNEVNWEGGSGRQPYSNQGRREMPSPAAGEEPAEGNRRERSGRNLEQLGQVKRKP
jgi:hypothetical protein